MFLHFIMHVIDIELLYSSIIILYVKKPTLSAVSCDKKIQRLFHRFLSIFNYENFHETIIFIIPTRIINMSWCFCVSDRDSRFSSRNAASNKENYHEQIFILKFHLEICQENLYWWGFWCAGGHFCLESLLERRFGWNRKKNSNSDW